MILMIFYIVAEKWLTGSAAQVRLAALHEIGDGRRHFRCAATQSQAAPRDGDEAEWLCQALQS
jgi:hypothetical protein